MALANVNSDHYNLQFTGSGVMYSPSLQLQRIYVWVGISKNKIGQQKKKGAQSSTKKLIIKVDWESFIKWEKSFFIFLMIRMIRGTHF